MSRFFEDDIESLITDEDVAELSDLSNDIREELGLQLGPSYRSWHEEREEDLPTPELLGYALEDEEDELIQELEF